MPTPTFFNLPEEKKTVLMNAAKKEFTRVPLNEASINKIIQAAGISRGSFYMYFSNKEELYFYTLQKYKDILYNNIKIYLDENNGDIISTYIDLFEFLSNIGMKEENIQFFRNLFNNMTYKTSGFFLPKEDSIDKNFPKANFMKLLSMIDKSKINMKNDEELLDILGLLTTSTFRAVMSVYIAGCPYEKIKEKYIRELEILKRGIYK